LRDGAWATFCDPGELESALLNLCINARDAMPDGGQLTIGTDDVRLTAADVADEDDVSPGDYVTVSVADTGNGIPRDIIAKVFEPFFTTKPLGQGTGLGLSQVYGFVRQSGGLVQLDSAPGRGTTVRLCLPRRERADLTPEGSLPAIPEKATSAPVVLLVDDEVGVRVPAAERLRELGYQVLEGGNGPEALRVMNADPNLDLLVTDVGLPNGMNGRQLAELVQQRQPELPVLFITGYAASVLPPGVEVIGKPFDLDTLARRVQAILAAGRR
jgi:CheY-like chemotaxis protein